MKQVQAVVVTIMIIFAAAQAYKFMASRVARGACSAYQPGTGFSAVDFVNYAVEHDSRDVSITDLSAAVPDPRDISNQITSVPIVSRTIKKNGILPAAFSRIDQLGLKGKATLVTKIGFAQYTCNITFEKGKVLSSLGSW